MDGRRKKTKEIYRSIVDNLNVGVFVSTPGPGGTFVEVNPAFLKIFGYENRAELMAVSVSDLYQNQEDRKKFSEKLSKEGAVRNEELKLKKKDGTLFTALESVVTVRNEKGEVQLFTGIIEDITERKNAEHELHRSEEKYRVLVENATDYIFMIDNNNKVLSLNKAAASVFRKQAKEVIGKSIFDLFPKKIAAEYSNSLKKVFGTGRSESYVSKMIVGGKESWLSVNLSPIRDQTGKVVAVEGVSRDITDSKKANEALEKSEAKLKAMYESTAEGILVADVESKKFEYANPSICRMLAYTEHELIRMSVMDIHPKNSLKGVISEFEAQARGEKTLAEDIPCLRKDGTVIYANINTTSIVVDNKKKNVGFFTDITKRKQTEEQLKKSLAEKEVLLKEIHHRVKNNMQIISSLLRIQAASIKDEKTQEVFRALQGRIRSMSLLYELQYKSKDLTKVDLAEYIRRLTTHLMSIYRDNIGVINLKLDVKDVYLDLKRAVPCGLIITELVSNSLKHAFSRVEKGEIEVKMHPNSGKKYILTVWDSGKGFPDELDFRKTESFGLKLVVDLIEQLNGSIELERTRGTAFKVVF
jgi:PAS domain S-box-containing protein